MKQEQEVLKKKVDYRVLRKKKIIKKFFLVVLGIKFRALGYC
jgi:hypothetical protein